MAQAPGSADRSHISSNHSRPTRTLPHTSTRSRRLHPSLIALGRDHSAKKGRNERSRGWMAFWLWTSYSALPRSVLPYRTERGLYGVSRVLSVPFHALCAPIHVCSALVFTQIYCLPNSETASFAASLIHLFHHRKQPLSCFMTFSPAYCPRPGPPKKLICTTPPVSGCTPLDFLLPRIQSQSTSIGKEKQIRIYIFSSSKSPLS